jgi:hypothetical protein
MVPREKWGHGNYHWKTNTISKLMKVRYGLIIN